MSNRKLSMMLAGCVAGAMIAMAILQLVTGVTQEVHEHIAAPEAYALGLIAHGGVLRALFGLDIAFCIFYTAFFAAFALYLVERGAPRFLVWLAFGTLLSVAVLDFVEDQHILAMLSQAEQRILPTEGAIAYQAVESATKFTLSFLALFLFGLCVPRDSKLGWALALFLTVGTLITGVLRYALPPASAAGMESTQWIGYLVVLGLTIFWLRAEPEKA